MLDAPQDPVRAVDAEEILELVERDEAARPGSLVELRRQVEQAQKHALDVHLRVRLKCRREPAGAERQPDLPGAKQRVDGAPERALKLAVVRALDPHHDARRGQHAFEVDECRRPAVARCVRENPAEQAGLAKPPRSHEPRRVPSGREREETRRGLLAVDHLLGQELSRDAKRIGFDRRHALSLHEREPFVYFK